MGGGRFGGRWLALVFGAAVLCFSNGVTANIYAAWAAPALLLLFVMTSGVWLGFLWTAVVSAIAAFVMFRGAIPVSDIEFAVTCIIGGVIAAVPFVVHRLVAPVLGAAIGSLVFPSVGVTLSYVLAEGSPFGTWGNDAYVQLPFAPIVQMASLTGVWGVAFLVYWFASALQALLTVGGGGARLVVVMFAGVLGVAIAFGIWRLGQPAPAETVQVAAVSKPAGMPDRFFEGCTSREDSACRSQKARARFDVLFAASREAAQRGAKLIVWYEAAAQYDAPEEAEFIARASAFARETGVYLIAGTLNVPLDGESMTNAAMAFTPDGQRAFEYRKAIPVPGEPIKAGDGVIKMVDTPFGRVGAIVCFDADFPALARQAATRGVDILAVPANDWAAITPLHGDMTRMRAIENGFSVVRAASNGLSVIADERGRVLAAGNSFAKGPPVILANVAIKRVATVQAQIGDLVAKGCALLSAVLILAGVAMAAFRRRPA